jgi:hypothetical protein
MDFKSNVYNVKSVIVWGVLVYMATGKKTAAFHKRGRNHGMGWGWGWAALPQPLQAKTQMRVWRRRTK